MQFVRAVLLVTAIAAVAGCGASTASGPLPTGATTQGSAQRILRARLGPTSILPTTASSASVASLCEKPLDPARASCFATYRTDSTLTSLSGPIDGLTPVDLSILYAYPSPGEQDGRGNTQTVAIAVAYDYAAAEADLAVYRARYGLPPCTLANGCLRKVGAGATAAHSAVGTPSSVSANPTSPGGIGWAAETDIDLDVVSAVCPNCRIVLAEAATDSIADLSAAVGAGIAANATIVNASFGAPEQSDDLQYASIYKNTGHAKVVAAAGDWGYGVYYPASDSSVIAVGGTSLAIDGWSVTETAWPQTGSGCSAIFAKPAWQVPPTSGCSTRNVVDVAAIADPLMGVAVYDSTLFGTSGGWATFGGTSVAAPIVAGMYALAGMASSDPGGAQALYAHPSGFRRVTSGSNGTCSPLYLCTAGPNPVYNGPTGLGVPLGLGGF